LSCEIRILSIGKLFCFLIIFPSIYSDGKLFVDEYNATSSMKASEVGFAITNMNPHMYQFNDSLSIIFYTRNLHFKNTKFASNQINNIVEALENYLDQKFPHKKLKYVTVPNSDLTLSEIKNGMIISSEMHILIDKNYTTFSENYVCEQLSLHLSQVWIHNYVSFKTREHYWLHDALGLFLQTVSLFELGKTSQAEHLILEDRLDALLNELNYKSTSLQYFSQHDIEDKDYYNFIKKKGASILRMFNYTLSKDVLKSAIKKYFTKMSDMEYADFIESFNLTQIDCSHIPRGLNVSDFMKRWVSSEKYPIVTVHKTNGSIVLHQTSYVEDEDAPKQTWSIPISFTNSTSKNFTAGFDYWLMEDNYTIIHNAYSVDDENSWILVNAMGRGYYRTNYDEGKCGLV
jgi:aminopeptidase N